MFQKMNKRGQFNGVGGIQKNIFNIIVAFIGIVLLFQIIAGLIPSVLGAFGNISVLNIPLASLFASGGVMTYVLSAVVILIGIGILFGLMGSKKK